MNFQEMNKQELRQACKEHGIKNYGKMNNDGMRDALVQATTPAKASVFAAALGQVKPAKFEGKSTRVVDGKVVNNAPKVVEPKVREKKEKAPAPVVARVRNKGYTIEKDRPVQNGVKRPSKATVCGQVWAALDDIGAEFVRAHMLNDIADKNGWNRTNVSCEFYAWRRFHGIKGRQSKK